MPINKGIQGGGTFPEVPPVSNALQIGVRGEKGGMWDLLRIWDLLSDKPSRYEQLGFSLIVIRHISMRETT